MNFTCTFFTSLKLGGRGQGDAYTNLSITQRQAVSFTCQPSSSSSKIIPGTYQMGECVGPRANLELVVKIPTAPTRNLGLAIQHTDIHQVTMAHSTNTIDEYY